MRLRSHKRSPIGSTRRDPRRESLEGVRAMQEAEATAAALDDFDTLYRTHQLSDRKTMVNGYIKFKRRIIET